MVAVVGLTTTLPPVAVELVVTPGILTAVMLVAPGELQVIVEADPEVTDSGEALRVRAGAAA